MSFLTDFRMTPVVVPENRARSFGRWVRRAFTDHRRRVGSRARMALVALIGVVVTSAVLAAFTMRERQELKREQQLSNQMLDVAQAMQIYVEDLIQKNPHHWFPTPTIDDKEGRPLHSWRVKLDPYLGEGTWFTVGSNWSWDDKINENYRNENFMARAYRPALGFSHDVPGETSIVAIVGPDTMISSATEVSPIDCSDGPSNTIVAVSLAGLKICWMQPADIPIDVFIEAARRGPNETGTRRNLRNGIVCLFADFSVRTIPIDLPPEVLKALCTRNGGEPIPPEALGRKWVRPPYNSSV